MHLWGDTNLILFIIRYNLDSWFSYFSFTENSNIVFRLLTLLFYLLDTILKRTLSHLQPMYSGLYLRPTHETRYAGKSCFASLKLLLKLQYFPPLLFPPHTYSAPVVSYFIVEGNVTSTKLMLPPCFDQTNSTKILFKSLMPNSSGNLHFVLFLSWWKSERKRLLLFESSE